MARIALILRFQWRAFWRRVARTRNRVQFYLTVLGVLGWLFVTVLPTRLSRAAQDLSAGHTASMDALLLTFCVLWLCVPVEDANLSLTSRRLRMFPIEAGPLLGVRVLSVFCSPVALLIALGSSISLWPFLSARRPVLGAAAAVWLFALALGLAMSASQLLTASGLRRRLVAPVSVIIVVLGAAVLIRGTQDLAPLRSLAAVLPTHLVSAASVAAAPSAAVMPLLTLAALGVAVGGLLVWSFRRSLSAPTTTHAAGRTVNSALGYPGRFGGLVRKELQDFRTLLDLWLGLLLVLVVSAASLFGPVPPVIRQAAIVLVFAANTNAFMNCFGMNTSSDLTRYAMLPLRGRDVLLIKNLAVTLLVATQLALLILIAAWRSGPLAAGAEVLAAAILLLSHFAWGNLVSVSSPFRMESYRFASGGPPLTAMAGTTIGSAPAIVVLILLQSGSPWTAPAVVGVVSLGLAAYRQSLRVAGRRFEHRRHVIGERLS